MEPLNILQIIVGIMLAVVLTFGIGFILNMLLKTTWIPAYLYVALVVYTYVFYESGKFVSNNHEYALVDYTIGFFGLVGAGLSGWTIKQLRQKGYRMF